MNKIEPTQAEHDALLPCPFCGDKRAITFKGYKGLWRTKCAWAGDDHGCGAETRVHDTEAEAVAAWNTRRRERLMEQMAEALVALRDYISDSASGYLSYEDSVGSFRMMAKEDLTRVDAILAAYRAAKGEA